MWGYNSRTGARPGRRMALGVEGLDIKVLPPAAVGPPLGPYVAAATSLPTGLRACKRPSIRISRSTTFLSGQLGSAVNSVQQQADAPGSGGKQPRGQPGYIAILHPCHPQPAGHLYAARFWPSRQPTAHFSGVYSATGPILTNALSDRFVPRRSQRASPGFPVSRLVTAITHNRNFPSSHTSTLAL